MTKYLFLFLLFYTLLYSQFTKFPSYSGFVKVESDNIAPDVSLMTVTADTNGADSVDMTIADFPVTDYNGNFYVRIYDTYVPSPDATTIATLYSYTGSDSSFTFAHTKCDSANLYIYVAVKDLADNLSDWVEDTLTVPFIVVNRLTAWSWQGKLGKTLEVDSVTAWVDQTTNGYSNTQATDLRKPLNNEDGITPDADDFLNRASPATAQDIGTGDFTISGRFTKTAANTLGYICIKYQTSSISWYVSVTANDLVLYAQTAGTARVFFSTATASNLIVNATEYTFSMVADRDGTGTVYLNGSPVTATNTTMSATAVTVVHQFTIGARYDAGNGFAGTIDWLQFDNEAKSATWASNFHKHLVNDGGY